VLESLSEVLLFIYTLSGKDDSFMLVSCCGSAPFFTTSLWQTPGLSPIIPGVHVKEALLEEDR
jgi:hypothetical protein